MRQDRRFQKKKGLTAEQKRLILLAGIVIVLILLIFIVFTLGQKNKASDLRTTADVSAAEEIPSSENTSETAGNEDSDQPQDEGFSQEASEEETGPDSEAETTSPAALLQKNSIPEILSVMEQYFTARANADADTINALYGVSGASADSLVAHRDQLLPAAKYISSFDDVTTYVMDGTAENNWLVYTTTDIRFFAATAKAPMIMWCFIEKGADDSYYILDNHLLSQDMLTCADIANHSDEVRELASEVNGRLRTALEEDADLDEVYGILRSGSPLWKDEEETEAEVMILDDSETVTESSAGMESEISESSEETAENDDEGAASAENDSQAETDTEEDTDTNIETVTDTGTDVDPSSAPSDAGTDADTDTASSGDIDTAAESSADTQ
ncbi:MAG: MSCRAMM family adhesin SdrC [Clostridiales bacterium]|nr:MSCRAMM family adhesin SdrC [Clostridiales bacterium]